MELWRAEAFRPQQNDWRPGVLTTLNPKDSNWRGSKNNDALNERKPNYTLHQKQSHERGSKNYSIDNIACVELYRAEASADLLSEWEEA